LPGLNTEAHPYTSLTSPADNLLEYNETRPDFMMHSLFSIENKDYVNSMSCVIDLHFI
jgi:hypothetical protein